METTLSDRQYRPHRESEIYISRVPAESDDINYAVGYLAFDESGTVTTYLMAGYARRLRRGPPRD